MDETTDKLISEKDFIPGTKMRIISRGSLWEECDSAIIWCGKCSSHEGVEIQAENVYTLGSINRELSEKAYLEIKKHIPKIIKEYIPVAEKRKAVRMESHDYKVYVGKSLRTMCQEIVMFSFYLEDKEFRGRVLWGGSLSTESLEKAVVQLRSHIDSSHSQRITF